MKQDRPGQERYVGNEDAGLPCCRCQPERRTKQRDTTDRRERGEALPCSNIIEVTINLHGSGHQCRTPAPDCARPQVDSTRLPPGASVTQHSNHLLTMSISEVQVFVRLESARLTGLP